MVHVSTDPSFRVIEHDAAIYLLAAMSLDDLEVMIMIKMMAWLSSPTSWLG